MDYSDDICRSNVHSPPDDILVGGFGDRVPSAAFITIGYSDMGGPAKWPRLLQGENTVLADAPLSGGLLFFQPRVAAQTLCVSSLRVQAGMLFTPALLDILDRVDS